MKTKHFLILLLSVIFIFSYSVAEAVEAPSLAAEALSESHILLNWVDTTRAESGFEVEMSLSPTDSFQLVAITGENATTYTDSGLNPGTTYYYRVRTYKNVTRGEETQTLYSPYSNIVSATTFITPELDRTAPFVPSNLMASADTCSQVSLSWNASTDNAGGSGLEGYKVYRDGLYIKHVQAPVTSTTDTDLDASTVYSYNVSAIDNAGNESGMSNTVTANTPSCPDTTPPSVPAGLSATAVSSSEIDLSWNPSTDSGSGVAGYKIYRDSTYIGAVTETMYHDSGLAEKTQYCYTVSAHDNAGNTSPQGEQVCMITLPDSPFGAHGYYPVFQYLADVGIRYKRNTAREGLAWNIIEPDLDGNYNWDSFDYFIAPAESLGIKLMVTINSYNANDQYCHVDKTCIRPDEVCTYNPCDWDKYETFLRNAIELYGEQVKYWQIENEPREGGGFYSDTPEEYAKLLSTSYRVIKEACPDCKVLAAGLMSTRNRDLDYYRRTFASCEQECFDIVDIHVLNSGDYNYLLNDYENINGLLSEFGYGGKPIWSTEFGPLNPKDNPREYPDTIENILIKGFVIALDTGFDKLFWRVSESPSKIIEYGEKTDTYYAYKTLISKLEGFNSIEKIADDQYKFSVNGKDVYVLWCDSGGCILSSEITGTVKVSDYQGNEQTMLASELILTESPVFVEISE